MKALRLLPLAYVADVHGFVLFAPYLLLVMTLAVVAQYAIRWRGRRVALLPSQAALVPPEAPLAAAALVSNIL